MENLDPMLDEDEEGVLPDQPTLSTTLRTAPNFDPDKHARRLERARILGIPPTYVPDDLPPDPMEPLKETSEESIKKHAPRAHKRLVGDPNFLALTKDDLAAIVAMEEESVAYGKLYGGAATEAVLATKQMAGGTMQAAGAAALWGSVLQEGFRTLVGAGSRLPGSTDLLGNQLIETGKEMSDQARSDIAAVREYSGANDLGELSWAKAGYTAIASSIPTLTAIGASIATRNPQITMAVFGSQVFGTVYDEGVNVKGMSPGEASTRAFLHTVAEAVPEALVINIATKPGQFALKSILARFTEATVANAAQEAITQALQIGIDSGIYDEKTTLREAIIQIAEASQAGIVGGGAMTVPQTAVDIRRHYAREGVAKELDRIAETEAGAEALTRLAERMQATKLFGRDREMLAEFVRESAGVDGVMLNYADLREALNALPERDQETVIQVLGIQDQVTQQEATGASGDLKIDLAAFVRAADREWFPMVIENARIGEKGMTLTEAKRSKEQMDAIQADAQAILDAADEADAQRIQDAEAYRAAIKEQLLATGKFADEADADVQATIHRDWALVASKKYGVPISDVTGELRVEARNLAVEGMQVEEVQEIEVEALTGTEVPAQEATDFTPGTARPDLAAAPAQEGVEVGVPLPTNETGYAQEETQAQKDGRAFREFFSSVVTGTAGKSNTGVPYTPVIQREDMGDFAQEYTNHRGNFDDHIAFSIPGFKEVQMAVGQAIAKTFGPEARMLDIGASEGSIGKTVTALGGPQTVSLDPNPDMATAFETHSQVEGATYAMAAFTSKDQEGQHLWDEGDVPVLGFVPEGRYEVVHEAMTFQFINNARADHVDRVKELLTDDGLAVFEEKFHNDNWSANEKKKDTEHKRKYFLEKDMTEKAKAILEGMNENMVRDTDFERILTERFEYVAQFWDSGNFKGYVATNNAEKFGEFLANVGDLQSGFSTVVTPRMVTRRFEQSTALRRGTETLKRFGWKPNTKYTLREMGAILSTRQQIKYGYVDPADRSAETSKRLAKMMVEEIMFEFEHPEDSGIGWYSTDFQLALTLAGKLYPELATDKNAREVFTLLMAVMSDGQKILGNTKLALDVYGEFRVAGRMPTAFASGGARNASMVRNMQRIQAMLDQYNGDTAALREFLLTPQRVGDIRKELDEINAELPEEERAANSSNAYPVDMVLPRSAVVFGPKLGVFYANLSGSHGYLTMDRWWSRTFNRYRGQLEPLLSRDSLPRLRRLMEEKGYDTTNLTNTDILMMVPELRKEYADSGFKIGDAVAKAANSIYKTVFEELNDSPNNSSDRKFMVETAERALKTLKRRGIDITLADLQAILWYYEKRLWAELGTKKSDDIGFSDAVRRNLPKGVSIEVAPDPTNVPLASAFDKLSWQTKRSITAEVAHSIIPEAAAELKIDDIEIAFANGGYGEYMNPTIIISSQKHAKKLPKLAQLLGDVWAQEAVVEFDMGVTTGEGLVDFYVMMPERPLSEDEQKALYDHLRTSVIGLDGFTWMQGAMWFGDFTGRGEAFVSEIEAAMSSFKTDVKFEVQTERFKSQLVEVDRGRDKKTGRGIAEKILARSRRDVTQADAWRARANAAIAARIERTYGQGARGGPVEDPSLSLHANGELRTDRDGLVPLTHWSTQAGLTTLDPAQHGTGAAGAERRRPGRIGRTYWGLPGYRVEAPVLSTAKARYFTRVNPTALYDINADPDGLREVVTERDPYLRGHDIITAMEAEAHARGYKGYWAQHPAGPVAAIFDPVDVAGELPRQTKYKDKHSWVAGYDEDGNTYGDSIVKYNQVKAFHGGHRFDAFSTEFIGTGEGNQAFGWGLYFASDKEVATWYRDLVKQNLEDAGAGLLLEDGRSIDSTLTLDDVPFNAAMAIRRTAERGTPPDAFARAAVKSYKEESWFTDGETPDRAEIQAILEWADKYASQVTTGEAMVRLYEVDLNIEEERLVHWDRPADMQPPFVQQVFKGLGIEGKTGRHLYEELHRRMGSQRDASMKLLSLGVPGVKYKDGNSRFQPDAWHVLDGARASQDLIDALNEVNRANEGQPKSRRLDSPGKVRMHMRDVLKVPETVLEEARNLFVHDMIGTTFTGTYNYVVFDAKDVQITEYWQSRSLGVRGEIAFQGSQKAIIRLFENADASTFLHESAHFFLERIRILARNNAEAQKDLQGIMAWMGVQHDHEIRTEHHEAFARGFEAYLREGKAPTAALRRPFETFKDWLVAVYQDVRELNVNIDDNLRGIFDNLLEADRVFAQSEIDLKADPLFRSQEEANMTDAEWARYVKKVADARNISKAELDAAAVEYEMKVLSAEWRKRVTAARTVIQDQLASERVMVARAWLLEGKGFPGVTPWKLSREEIQARFGDEALKKMPRGSNQTNGMNLDEAAEFLGYPSPDAMVAELQEFTTLSIEALRRAEKQVTQEMGFELKNAEQLRERAEEAIANRSKAEALYSELRALDGLSKAKGVPYQVLKAAAQRMVGDIKIRDLKPARFLAAAIRHAGDAKAALARKDYAKASAAKRAQILNHLMYIQVRDARHNMGKAERQFRRALKSKTIKFEYQEQIRTLLEAYDFAATPANASKRQPFPDFISDLGKAAAEVIVPASALDGAQADRLDLTVNQLRDLQDWVKNLETLGRDETKLTAAQRQADFEKEKAAILESIKNAHGENLVVQDRNDAMWHKAGKWVKQAYSNLLNMEHVFMRLDGGEIGGPVWKALWLPISRAQDALAERRQKVVAKLEEINTQHGVNPTSLLRKTVFIPEIDESLSLERRLSVALNWGNAQNRQRMLSGGLSKTGQPWTEAQIQAIIDSLEKQELEWVQAIWDFLDNEFWPDIYALEKELTGVPPLKVEPVEVQTKYGVLRGGYYPLKYDGDLDERTYRYDEAANVTDIMGGNWARAATRHGHTEVRMKELKKAVRTDLGVLTGHIDTVLLDLTHRKPVMDTLKLISDPEIANAIKGAAGVEVYREINPWLQWVAGSYKMHNPAVKFEALWRHLRMGLSIVGIGFRFSTALVNLTGIFPALVELRNPTLIMRHAAEIAANPPKARAFITERSAFMRDRHITFDREASEQIRKPLMPWASAAYILIAKVDMMVTTVTWISAYHQGMARFGNNEQAAIDYADSVVRTTQSSSRPADLSRIQRHNELMKLITTFYSYFNMIFNRTDLAVRKLGKGQVFEFVGDMVALWMLPAIIGKMLVGQGPDEDEEETWAGWAAKETFLYGIATIPVMRDLAAATVGGYKYNAFPAGEAGNQLVETIKVGMAIWNDEAEAGDIVKPAINFAGYAAHLPSGQINKSLEHLAEWNSGERDFNPWYLLMGNPKE